MTPIRVALVTNALGPPTRGNGTTVARWRGLLPDVDVEVTAVHPTGSLPDGPLDIVHGYHAFHGGTAAQRMADDRGLPLVVSLGGTDLFALRQSQHPTRPPSPPLEALFDVIDRVGRAVRSVIAGADRVTGAFASFGRDLDDLMSVSVPYTTVPRGVHVPDTSPPEPDPSRVRVLLPIGIRAVKDPFYAIDLFDRLAAELPISLAIVGPDLDPACGELVRERIARTPGIVRSDVTADEMAAEYASADVVWNTSIHEGGSNALLEGLAHGCAVFARDVAGNRDLLDGSDAPGTLFADDAGNALAFHRDLLRESTDERRNRVAAARAWLAAHHDSGTEARALRQAYEAVLS